MKKTLAVAAVVDATLAPSGVAFAGETGQGHGYGNCSNSAAGGVKQLVEGHAGVAGLGGFDADSSCRGTTRGGGLYG